VDKENWLKIGSRICMQKDLGINGNLFGGNMLSWMDEFAAIFAREMTCEKFVVTLRFGEIIFKKPVKAGDLVKFYCKITKCGYTSITFDIKALVDDIVFLTDATFVALDENGNTKIINWRTSHE